MNMTKSQKMMMGISIGDAFGAGYEFAFKKRSDFSDVDTSIYRLRTEPNFCRPLGMYTDDTQMSIAIVELLTSGKVFNEINLASFFVKTYKRDPINGYARGFQSFLDSIGSAEEFVSKIRSGSERNGAAMRAVPIGVIKDLKKAIACATINANLTHNTAKGIASSVAVAVISHFNYYYGRNPDISSELLPIINDIDKETVIYLDKISKMRSLNLVLLLGSENKDKGVPCDGMRTLGAVMYLLATFDNPKDILINAVKLGGDTDSVASIALGIHMINGSFKDLPEPLYKGLTNHSFGRDYLLHLGDILSDKYPV